jgi:WD40 repeat protein
MTDDPRLEGLLDALLESGGTPEEACRACPELLPVVRARWRQVRRLEADLDALFPAAREPATVPEAPPAGAALPRVPGYEVQAVLGRGGMGVVFRARHLRLGRVVALKMALGGAYADAVERERFQQEAEAVAALRHPGIVQIYDIGEHEGQPYFTMEFVEGGSLAQKLVGAPQPARQAAALAVALAGAVQAAHDGGILHRDLKPANVLLGRDGAPRITDFGLARRLEGAAALTLTGAVVGTPSYMAPEQARGKSAAVGKGVDVYALGAILYELLTGRPPFRAETAAETVHQVLCRDPVPPSWLNARVPRDLETVCLKCLQKDPQRRYPTAGELAADLGRFLRHEPIRARPVGWAERCLRWSRRHVGLTASLSGVALLLALLVVGSVWSAAHFREMERQQRALALSRGKLADEKEEARKEAVQAGLREAGLRQRSEAQAEELRRTLYVAQMNLGGQAAASPSGIGRVSEWLARWEGGRPDLRGWEWYYLKGLCHRDLLTLRGHAYDVRAVAWGKDGRLASAGADGVVRLWDVHDEQEVRQFPGHTAAVSSVAWGPDGRRLASAGWDGTVRVWDVAGGKPLFTFRGHAGPVFSVAWDRDGKRLASCGDDRTVQVWEADAGRGIHVLRGHTQAVTMVAWSPDGKQLASAGRDYTVRLWASADGKAGPVLTGHNNWVNGVAWSPDGKRLASASNDQTVKVWDAAAAKVTHTFRGHAQGVMAVAWSPDGRRLASGSEDQTLKVWPAAGGPAVSTLRGHTAALTSAAWSLDGARLATASFDAMVKVWDAHVVPETRTLRGHEGPVHALAWRRDGQRLASASTDGSLTVWDVPRGREHAALRGHHGRVHSAVWSPDGTRLASAGADQTIRLWDPESGAERRSVRVGAGEVRSLAWSPDGRRLASAGADHTVRVWDAATGREMQICRGHAAVVYSVAWSPDGARLASASADRTVRTWDASTGRETRVLRPHAGEVTTVAWSPDGKWLASAGYDQTVQVSDPDTGGVRLTLSGHTNRVNQVAWNPDGTRLVSASEDYSVRVWDAVTGKETLALGGHAGQVTAAAWRPDGLVLVSADSVGAILLHDGTPGYLAARSSRYLPTLDRRLAAHPKDRAGWRRRAEIHARLGAWEKAAADARQYLALSRDKRWFTLGCWVVGPYPDDLGASYPPEQSPDPGQLTVGGPDPRRPPLAWQPVPLNAQGFVNLGPRFGNAEHISAYALLRVYSPLKQQVAVLVGSDDYVRLRLNGKQIHEHLVARQAVADEDAVGATLEPGWNTFLARVVNVTRDHALYWRLSDAPADLKRAQSKARR